jgi:hypothetical protein
VIEQDAVAGIHPISFAIVYGDPVSIKLGDRVWTAWIKWRLFPLRNFLHQTIQLRCGRLIKSGLLFHSKKPDRFKQPQCTNAIDVDGIFRRLE